MSISTTQAKEIARRFLAVWGFSPGSSGTTIIEWKVVLNEDLLTTGETPRNFARRLLIVVARRALSDDSVSLSPQRWNAHLDGLGAANPRETVDDFVTFLKEVI